MARALTAEWTRIPDSSRNEAVAHWRHVREVLASEGCRHWVFASASEPGAYLEFAEASDPETVQRARARAGLPASTPILIEVELS